MRRPLAVMVENSPQARPQSGLFRACVVYEAITEGGITRFLAIYLHGDVETLGPVRSARPHFIYLAEEYDPVFVHCGESYEALQILSVLPPVYDLDQLEHPKPFWRSKARRAPHNLYTATEKVRAYMVKQGWESSSIRSLPSLYGKEQVRTGTPAREVEVSFGNGVKYQLRFVYDKAAGGYLRYMDGKVHVDSESGKPIVAKNIVIQHVAAAEFPDSQYHTYDVNVIGSGEGYFVLEGRQVEMRWDKMSSRNVTDYTDMQGNPLPFQPGQTWIEVVPLEGDVEFLE